MSSRGGSRVVSMGRPAVFLLRSEKIELRPKGRRTVAQMVHDFLTRTYGGYTCTRGVIYGHWRDPDTGIEYYGEHREYRVAFLGKDRIPQLKRFLARLATLMGEECIYLETGEDAWLVYADKQ